MTYQELADLRCPRCESAMESGFITGHWMRLRWCRKAKTKTIFAGTPLKRKRDFWNAPTLTAMRCPACRIGVFSYDN